MKSALRFTSFCLIILFTGIWACESSSRINLTGTWNITGPRLDFDIRLEESGNFLSWWAISRQGYKDRKLEVEEFKRTENKIYIVLNEDLGIGKTTYTYDLILQNNNLMTGTSSSYTGAWSGLPPIQNKVAITFRKK
ncbi:MAG: hypothetical protein AAF696_32475 [Bacteroidota bacterium]